MLKSCIACLYMHNSAAYEHSMNILRDGFKYLNHYEHIILTYFCDLKHEIARPHPCYFTINEKFEFYA